MIETGNTLIQRGACAGSEDAVKVSGGRHRDDSGRVKKRDSKDDDSVCVFVQARLSALDEQWQFLVNKSAEKSQKLKEANKQQNFNTGIKDFDFWLSEVKL